MTILAAVTTITYMTFSTAVTAWRRGTELAENIHHGDFVMEQLVLGLRSAYYPETADSASEYGFHHIDNGEGELARDKISWVKLGTSLTGEDSDFASGPHRVEFFVDRDQRGDEAAMVRAWLLLAQGEDFDSDEVEQEILSRGIQGFDCKTAFEEEDGEIEWLDEWEETNRLPTVVQITLYLTRSEEDERPFEMKRIVPIPVAPLSW